MKQMRYNDLGEKFSVIKNLLKNTATLRNFSEVFHPEKHTQDEALEEMVKELCLAGKIWLNKDESEYLTKNGEITKYYRFQNMEGFKLQLVIQDDPEEQGMQKYDNAENDYRTLINFKMISHFKLIKDDVATIYLKY